MAPPLKNVTSVILAGGRSRRFGSDKARALWRDRRLVNHVVERLPETESPRVLVLREEQDTRDWKTLTTVHDDPARNDGPLRGVIRGLEACTTEWAWVVACDQPLVSPELLLALLDNSSPADTALIPEWEGRLQPLTGLYAVRSGALLEKCSDQDEHSLIGALNSMGFRIFPEESCRRFDARGAGFINVNRPEHLDLLEGIES